MGIRALKKRDEMRRMEVRDLRKRITKLTSLLRKKEREIRALKKEANFGLEGETTGIDGVFAAIY